MSDSHVDSESANPYKGLRPYEEDDRDKFFGRDDDRNILVDQILANKLTLLFAASGAGKSSLLQAGVLPYIKDPKQENLDAIYYRDWISPPLKGLKDEILKTLQKRGRLDSNTVPDNIARSELKDFFSFCALFTRQPLVIVLDQFEEFFQYRHFRYKSEFMPFVEELSAAIVDQNTPCVFVMSMREDFALELDVFKRFLPKLYQNRYRLEKLGRDNARKAIVEPLQRIGFSYEPELLEALLRDLCTYEYREGLDALVYEESAHTVEPAYLQIICSDLWDVERNNPDKKIRLKTYQNRGGRKGILKMHFESVVSPLSTREQKLASQAFNYLITRRGTKMAYTSEDLSELMRVNATALSKVLDRLEKKRLLRSQSRRKVDKDKDELWYEIYHDLFSEPIKEWNEAFKSKQRIKQAIIISVYTLLTCGLLYVGFDFIANKLGREFRLSEKLDTIEIHRGKSMPGALDIFKLHAYRMESDFERYQVEPDKMFSVKPVSKNDLYGGIIDFLSRSERLKAYWEDGQVNIAMDLAKEAIHKDSEIVTMLGTFRSSKAIEVLKNSLDNKDVAPRDKIISALVRIPSPLVIQKRTELMANKEDPLIQRRAIAAARSSLHSTDFESILNLFRISTKDIEMRKTAADVLGWLRKPRAMVERVVEHLVNVFKITPDSELRKTIADALGRLNCSESVQPLIYLLKNTDQRMGDVRVLAATTLGQLGDPRAVDPLIERLNDPNETDPMRRAAISALGQLKDARAYVKLVEILQNEKNEFMRANVAEALGQLNDKRNVDTLIKCFNEDLSPFVRSNAAEALGQLGDARAVDPLCKYLNKPPVPASADVLLRWYVIGALGQLGDPQAIDSLKKTLFQDQDADNFLRWRAAEALGHLGDEQVVNELIEMLKSEDSDKRIWAAEALGRLGDTQAVRPLLDQLKKLPDSAENTSERSVIALALGRLGQAESVEPLIDNLNNPVPIVHLTSAYALKKLGDIRAVKPLLTRLTDDPDPLMRRSAADALGELGDCRAVEALIGRLEDPHVLVRRSAAKALGLLGDSRAINPLKAHLDDPSDFVRWSVMESLEKLKVTAGDLHSLDEKLKSRFECMRQINPQIPWQPIFNPVVMEPAIRVIRDERDKREIDTQAKTIELSELKDLANSDQVTDRKKAANILGNAIEKRPAELTQSGATLLIKLLDDPNLGVRSKAVESCGKAKLDEAIDKLVALLRHPNLRIQCEAAEALAKITEKPSINEPEKLYAAVNPVLDSIETAVPVRLALLKVLGNIRSNDAIATIIKVVEKDETSHDTLGLRAYNLLGDMGAKALDEKGAKKQVLDHLNQRLEKLEEKHAQWRKIRDSKQTGNSTPQDLTGWPTQHKPWAFVLAYNIARIDPSVSGLKLLSHDIADVRRGAWTGLGKVGDVSLIEVLHTKRSEAKKQPLFRHAAYRAIDHILIRLETEGDEETLKNLKTLHQQVENEQAVETRVDWTIQGIKWALEQKQQKGGVVDEQPAIHSSNAHQ